MNTLIVNSEVDVYGKPFKAESLQKKRVVLSTKSNTTAHDNKTVDFGQSLNLEQRSNLLSFFSNYTLKSTN